MFASIINIVLSVLEYMQLTTFSGQNYYRENGHTVFTIIITVFLQVDQINDTETRMPKSLQKKIYQQYFIIKPNREKSTRWAKVRLYKI